MGRGARTGGGAKPSILGGGATVPRSWGCRPENPMTMVKTPGLPPELVVDGALARVTLRRPALANRLSVADIEALQGLIASLRDRQDLRLVLLAAEGPHFCAGFQIDAVDEVDAPALFEGLTDAWEALPMPTLACIQGDVWGGAVDLALACDFRLGGPVGRVGIPAARLGLHYYGGGMQRLVSRLGLSATKRLLLAGEVWSDRERLTLGFLDAMADDLHALREQWVARLLALAPLAQAGMKRHLNAIARGALDAAALQADGQRCARSEDLAEGLAAWRERRSPRFSGR